jgi:hypothetical protein
MLLLLAAVFVCTGRNILRGDDYKSAVDRL